MTIGDFINKRRIELSLTLEDIGHATGVSKSTVKKWETGFISNMRRDRIDSLAKILRVDPSVFIENDINYNEAISSSLRFNSIDNIIPLPEIKKIPLIGTIACGEPILAEQNIEDYIDIPKHINADYALTCKGDSMINARIEDGDIVYIHQQSDVDNGEIGVILIDGEATLKRVYKYPNQLVLQAENPKYMPFVYSGEQLSNIRILGKAVGFTSLIKY